jgi:hypothetical protein
VVAHRGVPRCVSRRFDESVLHWCGWVVVVRGCPDESGSGRGRPGDRNWVERSSCSVESIRCGTWKAVTLQSGDPTPSYAPRLPGKNKSREGGYKICSSESSLSIEIEIEIVHNNTGKLDRLFDQVRISTHLA